MYAEDTDLCYKIHNAGFLLYYTSAVSVIHHGGGSSNQRERNYFADVVMRESLFRYLTKSRGKLHGYLYRVAIGVAAFSRVMLMVSFMALIPRKSAREQLKISLGKWINIFWWSLGFEEWVRNSTHEQPPV